MNPPSDSVASQPPQNNPGGSPTRAKRWHRFAKVGFSVIFMAIVLWQVNISEVIVVLRSADWVVLGLAGSLTFVGAILTASRWRVLLASQSVSAPIGHLVQCWMVACFFNQFLPSTIGGDSKRVYDSWKLGASKAGAVAAIGVDRILGLFALMIYGVVAVYLSSVVFEESLELRLFVVILAIALGLLATWIFYPTSRFDNWLARIFSWLPGFVRRIVYKLQQALGVYRGQGRVLALAMLFSVALQLNVIIFYFLIGTSLDLGLKFVDYMLIIPVASVVLLLPITINGVGLREGTFVLLLAGFGVPASTSLAFAWASFVLFTIFGLLGGVVYALQGWSN